MRKKLLTAAGSVIAVLTVTATAVPAHAAPAVPIARGSCTATGVKGSVEITDWHGPDATVGVKLTVADTARDNLQVRVRFISKNTHGAVKYWSWRTNPDGSGSSKTWNTTASDPSGLFDAGIEAATFSGGSSVNICRVWAGY